MAISRIQAIKRYMGENRPVENSELIAFKKADPEGFKWMGEMCASELGEAIQE